VDTAFADLVRGQPEVDEVLLHRRRRWGQDLHRPWSVPRATTEILTFAKDLRNRSFDVALDFQGNLKSGLWSWVSGAPVRVGFAPPASKEFNFIFNNVHVRIQPGPRKRILKHIDLLEGLDIREEEVPSGYHVEETHRSVYLDFLREAGIAGRQIALLSPGTSRFGAYKRWRADSWTSLARLLDGEANLVPVFAWGAGEEDFARELAASAHGVLKIPDRSTGFGELAAFAEGADLLVGVDSAPMHLAHLLGKPTTIIFGPTDPALYAPFLAPHETVRTDLPCMPCRTRGCDDRRCLDEISPEAVALAAKKLTAQAPGQGAWKNRANPRNK
jgi:ADP-heptose:LPS heptosyltransferase